MRSCHAVWFNLLSLTLSLSLTVSLSLTHDLEPDLPWQQDSLTASRLWWITSPVQIYPELGEIYIALVICIEYTLAFLNVLNCWLSKMKFLAYFLIFVLWSAYKSTVFHPIMIHINFQERKKCLFIKRLFSKFLELYFGTDGLKKKND